MTDEQQETRDLRRLADEVGFAQQIDPETLGVALEDPDDLMARLTGEPDPVTTEVAVLATVRPIRRYVVLGLVAAAVIAVCAVVIPSWTSKPVVAETPPALDFEFAAASRIAYAPGEDPAQILGLLATAADDASPPFGQGDVQYQLSDDWYAEIDDDGTTKVVPRVSQSWLRPDGSLTRHEKLGRPLSAEGRGLLPDDGGTKVVDETLGAGTVDADFEQGLPTEPKRLAKALLDHAECQSYERGPVRTTCLFNGVEELAHTYVVRPAVMAAVWRMLAAEEGIRTLGSARDRAGRDAVGIMFDNPDTPAHRRILLASLDDGRVLGVEDILVKRQEGLDVRPPAVLGFSTILKSRFTPKAPEPTGEIIPAS